MTNIKESPENIRAEKIWGENGKRSPVVQLNLESIRMATHHEAIIIVIYGHSKTIHSTRKAKYLVEHFYVCFFCCRRSHIRYITTAIITYSFFFQHKLTISPLSERFRRMFSTYNDALENNFFSPLVCPFGVGRKTSRALMGNYYSSSDVESSFQLSQNCQLMCGRTFSLFFPFTFIFLLMLTCSRVSFLNRMCMDKTRCRVLFGLSSCELNVLEDLTLSSLWSFKQSPNLNLIKLCISWYSI